jgi:hypothetical protein
MPNPEIEEFAKVLVEQVRDAAIKSCDNALHTNAAYPIARRWNQASRDGNLTPFANVMVPDTVDETVFHLLQAIDQGLLKLSFTTANGNKVDLDVAGLGELAGWYMGSGGWRGLYSKERFVDDFSDLA